MATSTLGVPDRGESKDSVYIIEENGQSSPFSGQPYPRAGVDLFMASILEKEKEKERERERKKKEKKFVMYLVRVFIEMS